MHGLINRSIQCFLRDIYGPAVWADVAEVAGLGFDNFEPMMSYDDGLTDAVLNAAAKHLGQPREAILEDIGTYLVANSNVRALRRLLRFGGVGFVDFLHSLDDLQGRGRLAVPDLELPALELIDNGPDRYVLFCRCERMGFAQVVMGILRAMADDYGALVILECHVGANGEESIMIDLLDQSFAEGRRFDLAAHTG